MKIFKAILLLLAFGLSARGQGVTVTASAVKVETVSGTCRAGQVRVTTAGVIWTCQSGTWASAGGSSGLTVGTTTVAGGTSGRVLYNNAGVLGQYSITGTGNVVLSASPGLTGDPTAPTATAGDNDTSIATTAFVTTAVAGASGGASGLLRGNLMLEWDLTDGGGQIARNKVYSTPPNTNLTWPQEQFTFSGFWVARNVTLTDNYANNPDGTAQTATRAVSTGGSLKYVDSAGFPMPAGIYVVSLWVKSNTGSSQTFRLAHYDTSFHFSGDLTATTSWQQFSFSLTAPAATGAVPFLIATDSSNNAFDLQIWGYRLEQGSTPGPATPQRWDLTLGRGLNVEPTVDPTWTNYGLYMPASRWGQAITSTPRSISQASVYAVVRWRTAATQVLVDYAPVINDPYGTKKFFFGKDDPGGWLWKFNGSSLLSNGMNLKDDSWHLVVGTYDGTSQKIYLDGVEMASKTSSQSAFSLNQLLLSNIVNAGNWPGDIGWVSVFDIGHSDLERVQQSTAIAKEMSQRGIALPTRIDKLVIFEGDSITDYSLTGDTGYAYRSVKAITPVIQARNFAVSGSRVSNMTSRAASVDAMYDAGRSKNVLHILVGRNDLDVNSAATFVANLKAYCLARKAAGWTVVVATVLPSTQSGFNTLRNSANTLILAETLGVYWDAVTRFDTVSGMGADGDASNATNYPDGSHPSATGHGLLYPAVVTSLGTVL